MPGCSQTHQLAARKVLVHILSDIRWRDDVVVALQDKRACMNIEQVGSVVGCERRSGEVPRDFWIGSTEAVSKFLR